MLSISAAIKLLQHSDQNTEQVICSSSLRRPGENKDNSVDISKKEDLIENHKFRIQTKVYIAGQRRVNEQSNESSRGTKEKSDDKRNAR